MSDYPVRQPCGPSSQLHTPLPGCEPSSRWLQLLTQYSRADRAPDPGARQGDGRRAGVQDVRARRRPRPQHGHGALPSRTASSSWEACASAGLSCSLRRFSATAAAVCARPWCSTTARTRRPPSSRPVTSTGPRSSRAVRSPHGRVPHTSRCCLIGPRRCLARLPLVPQRWYLRFPLAHDV